LVRLYLLNHLNANEDILEQFVFTNPSIMLWLIYLLIVNLDDQTSSLAFCTYETSQSHGRDLYHAQYVFLIFILYDGFFRLNLARLLMQIEWIAQCAVTFTSWLRFSFLTALDMESVFDALSPHFSDFTFWVYER
jgi:hypothetical protein